VADRLDEVERVELGLAGRRDDLAGPAVRVGDMHRALEDAGEQAADADASLPLQLVDLSDGQRERVIAVRELQVDGALGHA
jgi:hypothetical protein